MTVELVEEILHEFAWPVPYTQEDCDPDGVAMNFDGGSVVFDEGFESQMRVKLLAGDTGLPRTVTLGEVMAAQRAAGITAAPPTLTGFFSPGASLDKVRNGIRDQAKLLLTYLPSYFVGDRSWVDVVRPYVR